MNSTNLPSSFASAAAGQNANSVRAGRSDGRGSGEWSRRDGRATNGTLTFRRPSSNSLGQSTQPTIPAESALQSPAVDMVPRSQVAAPTTAESGSYRYSKDELLEISKLYKTSGSPSPLFMPGWNPGAMNGNSVRGWGKSEHQVAQDPDICWDPQGDTLPISFQEYTAEEKEILINDINSPLKLSQPKDANHPGGTTNGRKTAQVPSNLNPGLTSPSSAARPSTRRRETTEPAPFGSLGMTSPTAARFARDDQPSWFGRKGQDVKEAEPEEMEDETAAAAQNALFGRGALGGIIRSNTTGNSNLSNLWNQSAPAPAPPAQVPPVGSFGNFALPAANSAVGDKRFGAARESRLAHLIPKDSPGAEKPQESPGIDVGRPWAARLAEAGGDPSRQWKARPRTDTDPFGEENLTGSAALGGSTESPPQAKHPGRGLIDTPSKGSAADFGMSRLDLGSVQQQAPEEGPISPSTNPYGSPPGERRGAGGSEADTMGSEHGFAPLTRGFSASAFDGGDRSQTSSTGPRAYPPIGNMGWAPPATTGPERGGANYGNAFPSIFGGMGDLASPAASAFGMFGAGAGAPGSGRGGSKMQAFFQTGVPAPESDNLGDSLPDLRQSNPLGTIGRNAFGLPARETDSPIRSGRGMFDGFFPPPDPSRNNPLFSTSEANVAGATTATAQPAQPYGTPQPATEPTQSQVRQMVMPDRMRWVYLDSQGKIQGPFTGLEMNDWYKANFFTADLRVKKVEDPDFEPLGSLIRRIGNSREPFLVPQIGIPHGPPATGPFSPTTGGMVPPLSGVFPAYGRTLTADEQNNLERRKQEEQYMMAQQREFMSRQHAAMNMTINRPHAPTMPVLQHHSSAHSLHSQPSYGSMASPAPPAMPPIGAIPTAGNAAMYDPAAMGHMPGAPGHADAARDEEVAKWRAGEHQVLGSSSGMPGTNVGSMSPQPIGTRQADISLRSQLPRNDQLSEDSEGFRERLQEFDELRAQHEAAEAAAEAAANAEAEQLSLSISGGLSMETTPMTEDLVESLSLAQQVQNTQAAVTAAEMGIPMPFPPAPDATPIAAPTAQRARSNLPEQYNRQQSETPELAAAAAVAAAAAAAVAAVQPPPLAPWAREPGLESQKGPSLKEIQEAEARKAAKAEEAAAAARKRQAQEQEAALREREKLTTQAPGLPMTSTWGSGSPVTPVAPGPWAKPSAAPSTSAGKTLADIQREEELRKQKAKETAMQSGTPSSSVKSYANLAGKMSAATPPQHATPPAISGWALVGANGKVKIPTGPASQVRSVSSASAKPTPPKPATKQTLADKSDFDEAQEEFKKWVHAQLTKGIDSDIDIDSLVDDLEDFPLDSQIIAEAVYANSKVMDGNHFGLEYVRRKRLADKGVVEKQPVTSAPKDEGTAGGWNEVARKGGNHEGDVGMQGAGFKVVPGRKKGKK